VQEVVVSRNSYDAEFGKSGGGVVSVVTKGGSSQFHGSVFEFFRNDNLDANTWANNRVGRPRVEFKRNQLAAMSPAPSGKAKSFSSSRAMRPFAKAPGHPAHHRPYRS